MSVQQFKCISPPPHFLILIQTYARDFVYKHTVLIIMHFESFYVIHVLIYNCV